MAARGSRPPGCSVSSSSTGGHWGARGCRPGLRDSPTGPAPSRPQAWDRGQLHLHTDGCDCSVRGTQGPARMVNPQTKVTAASSLPPSTTAQRPLLNSLRLSYWQLMSSLPSGRGGGRTGHPLHTEGWRPEEQAGRPGMRELRNQLQVLRERMTPAHTPPTTLSESSLVWEAAHCRSSRRSRQHGIFHPSRTVSSMHRISAAGW